MVAINFEMPKSCYDCPFAENKRTNDYGSFCECGILEDYEIINLLEHSKHPNCPLVEIEERKQSEWYLRGGKFTCKNCEERALLKLTDATGGCREYSYYTSKFCPNCGADMRGSEE